MDITVRQILEVAKRAREDSGDDPSVLDEVYTIESGGWQDGGEIYEGLVFYKTNDPKAKVYPLGEMTVHTVRGGIE